MFLELYLLLKIFTWIEGIQLSTNAIHWFDGAPRFVALVLKCIAEALYELVLCGVVKSC